MAALPPYNYSALIIDMQCYSETQSMMVLVGHIYREFSSISMAALFEVPFSFFMFVI